MYRDIAPEDPEGTLQHIWLNARGAIARFDRGAIEIRVLDIQECPQADIAIGSLMVATLQALCAEKWTRFEEQSVVPTEELASLFRSAIIAGPATVVPQSIAKHFGPTSSVTVGQLWQDLLIRLQPTSPLLSPAVVENLNTVLSHGTLSQRILANLNNDRSRSNLQAIYGELSQCLQQGEMFAPAEVSR